ncbi:uncharacterized protein DMENIID0001_087640 [Sergentomyia squamirostris]
MAGSEEANYALNIALTTLENRLSVVQEENHQLRLKIGERQSVDEGDGRTESEVEVLRAKVADLTRQKMQLTDHIAMVATENRQLWSRLSRLTKDKAGPPSPVASQNLIRSKTFTQNAPNPKLRDKLPDTENLSLEEISLRMLNDVTDAKQQLEKNCHEIMTSSVLGDGENLIGFGFLAEEGAEAEGDATEKMTKILDKCKKLRSTLVKQQTDLKIMKDEQSRKKLKVCRECQERAEVTKPVTVSIDSQTDFEDDHDESLTPPQIPGTPPAVVPPQPRPRQIDHSRIDLLEQKRLADVLDKMCPMCGKIYSTTSRFEEFQEHVESHFVDENEMELSLDRNFEIVSNF